MSDSNEPQPTCAEQQSLSEKIESPVEDSPTISNVEAVSLPQPTEEAATEDAIVVNNGDNNEISDNISLRSFLASLNENDNALEVSEPSTVTLAPAPLDSTYQRVTLKRMLMPSINVIMASMPSKPVAALQYFSCFLETAKKMKDEEKVRVIQRQIDYVMLNLRQA